jgi:hypothetical protein
MTLPKIKSIALMLVAGLVVSTGMLDAAFHKEQKKKLDDGIVAVNGKCNAILGNFGIVFGNNALANLSQAIQAGKLGALNRAVDTLNNATGDEIDAAVAGAETAYQDYQTAYNSAKQIIDTIPPFIQELKGIRDYLWNRSQSDNKSRCILFDSAVARYNSLLQTIETSRTAYQNAMKRISLDIPVVGTFLSSQTTSPTPSAKLADSAWNSAQVLSAPGRGAIEFTLLCAETAGGAEDQSNFIIAFIPAADKKANPYQNTFFAHVGSPVTTNGVTMANRSSYVSLGVPPAKETLPAAQAVFPSPASDVIANNAADGRDLVPVDVRVELDQALGHFAVKIKPHNAADSAYKLVIMPNVTIKALLNKVTLPLQFFAFGSQLASSTIYDLRTMPLEAVAPEGFDEISGEDAIAQNGGAVFGKDGEGKSTIFAPSDTGVSIVTIHVGDKDDAWEAMPFDIPVELDKNVTIAQLAANKDKDLYVLIRQASASAGDHDGAVYYCNLSSAKPSFATLGNATVFRAIATCEKNSLFALDASGNVWHASGPGALTKMTASGLAASTVLKNLTVTTDGLLLALDANGNAWLGLVDMPAKAVAFTALVQKVGDQPFSLQSVAAASKSNIVGVTQSGQVVMSGGTDWKYLSVSSTDPNPVMGFDDIAMDSNGAMLLVAYDTLYHKQGSAPVKGDSGKDKDKDKKPGKDDGKASDDKKPGKDDGKAADDKKPGTDAGNKKPRKAAKPARTAGKAAKGKAAAGKSRRTQAPAKRPGKPNKVIKPAILPNLGTGSKDVKPDAPAPVAPAAPATPKVAIKPAKVTARPATKKKAAASKKAKAANKKAPAPATPAA